MQNLKKKKTVKKATGKDLGGRPTKYKTSYVQQGYKLALLGATDKELSDFFEISESTLNEWKIKYPQFSESIKKGKMLADANVADRLYQRAMGFEHNSEEIKVVSIGQGEGSEIKRVKVRKIYPPDTIAAIFWLKNRQKKNWRDKIEQGFTDGDGNDINPVTIFQIPDNGRNQNSTTTERLSGEGPQQ